MAYVPIVPPSDRTRMTARARELATQLERVIQEFQRSYPDTPKRDVQEALRALSGDADRAPGSRRLVAALVAGGVGALVAILIVLEETSGGLAGTLGEAAPWIVMGAIFLLALVMVALRRR
jgi:hypothetical protein